MNHKCYYRKTDNQFKEYCEKTGEKRNCVECNQFENMVDKIGRDTFMGQILADKIGDNK